MTSGTYAIRLPVLSPLKIFTISLSTQPNTTRTFSYPLSSSMCTVRRDNKSTNSCGVIVSGIKRGTAATQWTPIMNIQGSQYIDKYTSHVWKVRGHTDTTRCVICQHFVDVRFLNAQRIAGGQDRISLTWETMNLQYFVGANA
uniref:Uncharacterized protein n=1 Tax=Glossina pallidipes TaxID=7398 RepID=A0A1A9ZKK5_GLOPL